MPKIKVDTHVKSKLTHAQCRERVCLICFESKKSTRVISSSSNFQAWNDHLKTIVGPNFDVNDQRQPDSICETCRLKYFSKKAIEDKKHFVIPQYLQMIVAPQDKDEVCDCEICLKVRNSGGKQGLKKGPSALHAGGRPKLKRTPLKAKKPSPGLCKGCLCMKGPGHDHNKCNPVTKTKNLLSLCHDEDGEPNKFGEKVASSVIKGMKPSPNGTIYLSIPRTGKKLPITVGRAKPFQTKVKVMAKDLLKLQTINSFSDTATKNIGAFINQMINKGTVEVDYQEKLRKLYSRCDDFFEKEIVKFTDEKTGETTEHAFAYVKDLSQFLLFVIAVRRLDIQETQALIGIDKGGKTLKITLTVCQEEEVEGEFKSTGVMKSFVVAAIALVKETSEVIRYMFEKINAWETDHLLTNDFRVANIMCGIGSHGSKCCCCFCIVEKEKLGEEFMPLRTIRSLFEDYEGYKKFCEGKSKTQQKGAGKLFHSVVNKPILVRGEEEDLDDLVLSRMPMDELHILTGCFDKLYVTAGKHETSIEKWPQKILASQKAYHGGTFIGNDAESLLINVGDLENIAREKGNFTLIRFVSAFRALNEVRKAIFTTELKDNWEKTLEDMKFEIRDLIDDEGMQMSCTPKFHILIFHVKQWCEMEIANNPDAPRGLGKVSTQASESMHCRFAKHLANFNPNWSSPNSHLDTLFRATKSWAGKHLWPQEDGDRN